MPARKKRAGTRQAKTKRDNRPKLPEGDFNTSISNEEQKSKLDNYIIDYKLQVACKIDKMRKSIQTMRGLIANCYRNGVVGLVKWVKDMPMEEFLRRGGSVDLIVNTEVHASLNEMANNPRTILGASKNSRPPLPNVSNNVSGSISDQTQSLNMTASNVQTAGKSTRKKKLKPENSAPPTATRTSRRLQAKSASFNNEVTPMTSTSTLSVINHSMFVTPKFDPRLPIPKTAREPKAGESVMSLAGSPLNYNNSKPVTGVSAPQIIIPLTGGKVMQLNMDGKLSMGDQEVEVVNDSVAQQNIRLLQEKLSKLMKMPSEEME
ncbi:borealin-like [Dendronephthya gigantea]|uniref:borealin-like n=1 Tax=Dendronephthya gigantea TaxID=151771 RepID=UPI00106B91B6|nr:borealin-like [Dendronephthya gigantea]